MVEMGIIQTPTLDINGKVVLSGFVPDVKIVRNKIKENCIFYPVQLLANWLTYVVFHLSVKNCFLTLIFFQLLYIYNRLYKYNN